MDNRVAKIIEAIEEKKGKDILVLQLTVESRVCDYVVLATGSSNRNVQAISDEIDRVLKEENINKLSASGYQEGEWVLMDYADIVVHVFAAPIREYYQLEELYSGNNTIYESC